MRKVMMPVDIRIPGELKFQYFQANNVPVVVEVEDHLIDEDSLTPEGLRIATDKLMKALADVKEYSEEDIDEGW